MLESSVGAEQAQPSGANAYSRAAGAMHGFKNLEQRNQPSFPSSLQFPNPVQFFPSQRFAYTRRCVRVTSSLHTTVGLPRSSSARLHESA